MSRVEEVSKRRCRPRFSLRLLIVVVTLICAYFGAWEATKRFGVNHVERLAADQNEAVNMAVIAPVPFLVYRVEGDEPYSGLFKRYYLWFPGISIRLPFQSNW
jgi:hypothetical protein